MGKTLADLVPYYCDLPFDLDTLVGETFTYIACDQFTVAFGKAPDDILYYLAHDQDCCESVYLADICGDITDLLDKKIIKAEVTTNIDNPPSENAISWTWTFYTITAEDGSVVTLRWCGESNGYYSEAVDLFKVSED